MSLLLHNTVLIQLIGFIALGIDVFVYQLNKRKPMLKLAMWDKKKRPSRPYDV